MFYTYLSYESWAGGRSYIGYRTCPAHLTPETDPYMGSYKDSTFKPNKKIIFKKFYCVEFAIEHEVELHEKYNVDKWEVFANRSKQTSSKFRFSGAGKNNPRFGKIGIYKHSQETKKKISEANKGKNNYWFGKKWGNKYPMLGKKPSEITRQKWSQNRKGKNIGELNPFFGKTHSKETKQKLAEVGKKLVGELNPFYGKTHSEKTKEKMRGPRPSITGRNHPKYKTYNWYNSQHGEFICSSGELRALFPELTASGLSRVISGKNKKPYKGWSIKK
jgi:hypothetical protein